MNISAHDITVVVYGRRNPNTRLCLDSIREVLPGAQIILSTWKGTHTKDLTFDKLVLSDEPKAFYFTNQREKYNNINKIIVSISRGLAEVNTGFVLVMRGDMQIKNRNILSFQDNFECREAKYSLFVRRVFAYEMFSIQFEMRGVEKYYTPFHISDWCYFGLSEDVRELFNLDEVSEPDFSQYFLSHPHDTNIDIWPNRLWRMSPEQYLISSNAAKVNKNMGFQDRLDLREEVIEFSNRFIVNNFIIKSIEEWGIAIQKDDYKGRDIHSTGTTSRGAWLGKNWILAYREFCDHSYPLSFKYKLERILCSHPFAPRIAKHYKNFVKPMYSGLRFIKRFVRWMGEPIAIIYYFVRMICAILSNLFRRLY